MRAKLWKQHEKPLLNGGVEMSSNGEWFLKKILNKKEAETRETKEELEKQEAQERRTMSYFSAPKKLAENELLQHQHEYLLTLQNQHRRLEKKQVQAIELVNQIEHELEPKITVKIDAERIFQNKIKQIKALEVKERELKKGVEK